MKVYAYQPVTAINNPPLRLVRFGDFYPSSDGLIGTIQEIEIDIPQDMAIDLAFEAVVTSNLEALI